MSSSRPAQVAAALLAAALTLTAAVAGSPAYAVPPGWSDPTPLPDTAGVVNQVSDTAPDGADATVWVTSVTGGVEIRARVRGPGLSTWQTVAPIATDQAQDLAIAADRHGDFWVAWVRYVNGVPQVRVAVLRTSSADFSASTKVFSFDGYASAAPRIAVADDGTVFVAATAPTVPSQNPPRYRVEVGIKRAGRPWVTRFVSPRDANAGVRSLAVSPNGHAVVAFMQGDTVSDFRIRAATRPAGASSDWTVTSLSAPGDGQSAKAAIGPDGTVAVEWQAPASASTGVRLARRDITGGGDWVVNDLEVGPDLHFMEQPSVAPDGSITALWWNGRLYARQVEGGVVGPAVPVTPAGIRSDWRDVEMTSDGRVALAYQSYDGAIVSQGLSLVLIDHGTPGSPLQLTSAADGSANTVDLGLDAADGANVLWTAGDYPATELVSTGNPPLVPSVITRPHFGTPVSTAVTTGKPRVGRTLTCRTGYLVEARVVRWRWFRDDSAIRGAREPRYQLRAADRGSRVRCSMSAFGLVGTTDLVSQERRVR